MKLQFRRWRPTVSPREDLIIRDYLALDRTRLSNERSLLAYYRTGLTTLVSGVTGFNVFHDIVLRSTSMMLIICGVGIMVIGIVRYYRFRRRIKVLGETDYTKGKP